ncbi:hypothetical protein [Dyadobacter sp. CY356]|uniref:hypothetical protein n=1 Tax=Dyadobacter sp. CY356 TaxID=2906442 RepID=UPI001F4023EB|nr:hypothetical protein [Dyadobacter sp. CY356]MCF0058164.1 hypothetical protein [Dyadobacter sp. CY356]
MNRLLYPLIFTFILLLRGVGYCQPADAVYANSQTNDNPNAGISSSSVTNPQNALTNTISNTTDASFKKPNSKFTTLKATALSTVTGSASAWIQLAFVSSPTDVAVPANTTVYVKSTTTAAGLLGLVGGAGLTFTAYASNTGNASPVALAGTPKIYYTADGNIYFAVKPTSNFKSIRITLAAGAVLGDGSVDIFYAFYGPNQSNDTNPFPFSIADCGLPNVTSTAFSGITVGSVAIVNPGNSIDTDVSTGSAYNSVGANIAGHMIQTFHFNGNSNSGDAVRVVFSKGSALANIDVGKAVTIQAYSGGNSVGKLRLLSSLLDADLLGLLTTGNTAITSYFAPKDDSNAPVIFDRVILDFDLGLLGISLNGNGLNVFDVRRVPDAPTTSDVTACTNVGTINLAATTIQNSIAGIGNFTYTWYNAVRQGTLLGTLVGQIPFVATGLTTVGTKQYYVDITKSGCTVPSGRTRVTVNTVNPPIVPPIALVP